MKAVPVVIESAKRTDGLLSVVRVEPGCCVLSTGEECLLKFGKLQTLVEQLCAESSAVTVRLWWTPEGTELVEIHRLTSQPAPPEKESPDVF